jgi:hypothetical protein
VSVVEFFRLQCDGGCGRWLSDITPRGLARMTVYASRALVFDTGSEAMDASVQVGWTKEGERPQGLSLCGNCRAKKQS